MNGTLDLILEALFTGADEAEEARRDEMAPDIMAKEWVEEFLKRKDIKKNSDGSYDVIGNAEVDMGQRRLKKIPLKFNKVHDFYCEENELTSLEGSPRFVQGEFWCQYNQLTSLKGAPDLVGGNFDASFNDLNGDLTGAPRSVGKHFIVEYNQLTSLNGAPKEVDGAFICGNNRRKFTAEDIKEETVVGGWCWR